MKTDIRNNLSVFKSTYQNINISLHVLIILISLSTTKSDKHSFAINPTYPLLNSHHLRSLRKQWEIQVPNDTFRSDFLKMRLHYPEIVTKITREEPPGSSTYNTDCLMLCTDNNCQRGEPRKPPGTCYNYDFAKIKNTSQTPFWNFWSEISRQFSYTFDFVLWEDNNISTQYNQLWYLILYLKSLVDNIFDPFDIMSIPNLNDELKDIQILIDDVAKEIKKYRNYKSSVIKSINEINNNIAQFQIEKTVLALGIKKIVDDTYNYDRNSKFMDERIKEINGDVFAIKSVVDHFSDTTMNKFFTPQYIEATQEFFNLTYESQTIIVNDTETTTQFNIWNNLQENLLGGLIVNATG